MLDAAERAAVVSTIERAILNVNALDAKIESEPPEAFCHVGVYGSQGREAYEHEHDRRQRNGRRSKLRGHLSRDWPRWGHPCDFCMREQCCAEMASCREYACVLCANNSTGAGCGPESRIAEDCANAKCLSTCSPGWPPTASSAATGD